jgi:hypothetical protein
MDKIIQTCYLHKDYFFNGLVAPRHFSDRKQNITSGSDNVIFQYYLLVLYVQYIQLNRFSDIQNLCALLIR